MSKNAISSTKMYGTKFLGTKETKMLNAIFAEIADNEKAVIKLAVKTARSYYDAGNILAPAIKRFNWKAAGMSAKAIAEASGFPANRIILSLKIFKAFENNPDALKSLTLRDALRLIAPPPPAGEEGYNRVDLGGDPRQKELDFGELFNLPAVANNSLKNYRTVGDLLDEIIVVSRDKENRLISKCFNRFYEDIPQDPELYSAFKTMSMTTQAAIEDYLAVVEQKEKQK